MLIPSLISIINLPQIYKVIFQFALDENLASIKKRVGLLLLLWFTFVR